jgi:hydrogenase/urease accessory protein HupE
MVTFSGDLTPVAVGNYLSRRRSPLPAPFRLPVFLVALVAAGLPEAAWAHPFSQSNSVLLVSGRDVRAMLTLDLLDLHSMADLDRNHDTLISVGELDAAIERVSDAVSRNFLVRAEGPAPETTVERYQLTTGTRVRLEVVYRFPGPITTLEVTSTLDTITQPNHRHLMSLSSGGATQEAVLEAGRPTARFDTSGGSSHFRTFTSFLWLGVEHIFTGYDHLAFLVGLLIATGSFRSLVKIVTSFTIAHSVTLGLATFDAVVLPTKLTESLIALSIAYVAAENLLRSQAIERYRITFLFGLIHGFGFSTILREMQLPRGNLALSLFSFNAGVEVGQLAFVGVVFPAMLYLTASRWRAEIRSAVSFGVVCLSVYWFVQRAFL